MAWEKRRGGNPPFNIRSCETGGENAGSGNGGANSLAIRLKGIAADHPHAVIGLFDYDAEGFSAYKLDRNFVEITVDGFAAKRGIHGKSYAACLPAPAFRSECYEYKNLPIEFLFRDAELHSVVGGKRLGLRQKKASIVVGDRKIEKPLDDFTHFKEIAGGKSEFAQDVAPTFDAASFDGFDPVFKMIEGLISYSQS